MNEEEIIKKVEFILNNGQAYICSTTEDLVDLYKLYKAEKEKNISDMIKDVEFSNFIKERYIMKDKIRAKIEWYEETCKHLSSNGIDLDKYDQYKGAIEALQELLEEE